MWTTMFMHKHSHAKLYTHTHAHTHTHTHTRTHTHTHTHSHTTPSRKRTGRRPAREVAHTHTLTHTHNTHYQWWWRRFLESYGTCLSFWMSLVLSFWCCSWFLRWNIGRSIVWSNKFTLCTKYPLGYIPCISLLVFLKRWAILIWPLLSLFYT